MNEVQIFNHEMFGDIRTTFQDGTIWFIAKDVANSLGYTNPQKAIRDHCRGVNETLLPTNGGVQRIAVIQEADVYRLVMRSQLESAVTFQDWVCEEVLPSLRKTGNYVIGGIELPNLSDPVALARAWADAFEQKRIAEEKVQEMKPKADFYDAVTADDTVCQLGVVCQMIEGMPGRNTLFRYLREQGVLISSGDRKNHPMQTYV
ncbi:MAG: phage antirepressor KilAC domain-containing protein, partial [Planctomycetales bacterium]|nr:phage antirepressor KilAC domain-containing protein [Planctomycetales bacterium]